MNLPHLLPIAVHRLAYHRDSRMLTATRIVPAPTHAGADSQSARGRLQAAWLTRVRWGAFGGQLLAIAVGKFLLHFGPRLFVLFALSGITATTNLWLGRRVRREMPLSRRVAGWILLLDTATLTALLYVAGGPSNPFSVLYLVQITVAAVMLGSRWTWGVAAFSSVCYAFLFLLPHDAMHSMDHANGQWTFSLHLEGMWLALVTAAALTAYFVTRLSSALDDREAELGAMRETTARQERLAAVTTLAAGAAHELATPMATIAVTARELERAMGHLSAPTVDTLRDDARLIRSQVERCGDILRRMAPANDTATEPAAVIAAETIAVDVRAMLSAADRARLQTRADLTGRVAVCVPRAALTAAIVNLVRNALDASPCDRPVLLRLTETAGWLTIAIEDHGTGMPPAVLSHAGEPFFTTKAPGQGMGLGIFLARTLAERLGGRLVLQSAPGAGTRAVVELPMART